MALIEDAIKLVQALLGKRAEFIQLRTEIDHTIGSYLNVDTSSEIVRQGLQAEVAQEARRAYGNLAVLVADFKNLPFYKRWLLPTCLKNLESAEGDLTRLSNETGKVEAAWVNDKRQRRVKKALRTRRPLEPPRRKDL